jgi:hypothetical protein
MFQPLKGHLHGVHLTHLNSKVGTVAGGAAALVTHFVDLAVQKYQMYS